MKPRIGAGRITRKVSDFDSTDHCGTCREPMLKGQEIEVLAWDNAAGHHTKALHAGSCMDSFLAWLNTAYECEEERADGDPNGDCAVQKSLEERDPLWRRITEGK